jgi:hypothetical protein
VADRNGKCPDCYRTALRVLAATPPGQVAAMQRFAKGRLTGTPRGVDAQK